MCRAPGAAGQCGRQRCVLRARGGAPGCTAWRSPYPLSAAISRRGTASEISSYHMSTSERNEWTIVCTRVVPHLGCVAMITSPARGRKPTLAMTARPRAVSSAESAARRRATAGDAPGAGASSGMAGRGGGGKKRRQKKAAAANFRLVSVRPSERPRERSPEELLRKTRSFLASRGGLRQSATYLKFFYLSRAIAVASPSF